MKRKCGDLCSLTKCPLADLILMIGVIKNVLGVNRSRLWFTGLLPVCFCIRFVGV